MIVLGNTELDYITLSKDNDLSTSFSLVILLRIESLLLHLSKISFVIQGLVINLNSFFVIFCKVPFHLNKN